MASLSNMLILVIGLLGLYGTVRSDPDTSVTLILCNGGGYTKGDPFATSLTYVVEDLEAKTPKRKGYNYHNISPYPNSFAYGYASCSQNLTSKDCSTCLSSAKTAMFGTCDNRIGARAVLHDCQIRSCTANPFNPMGLGTRLAMNIPCSQHLCERGRGATDQTSLQIMFGYISTRKQILETDVMFISRKMENGKWGSSPDTNHLSHMGMGLAF
ncbi:hypothetical protein AAG906_034782 [Vitis piasezkii]